MLVANCQPALALLGRLEGPGGELELLAEIRVGERSDSRWEAGLPVLVLGGEPSELALLRAFDAGADDYVDRAATYLELRARLRSLLRRAITDTEADRLSLRAGPLTVDVLARRATLDGASLALRRMEFELLAHLARDPDVVWSRQQLLRLVWGYRASGRSRTVDSHASRLRRKLDPERTGRWIVSVRGIGYRLT